MPGETARAHALKAIRSLVAEERVFDWDSAAGLQGKDQALFHELVLGTLRNWRYLEMCVLKHCGRRPKRKLFDLVLLSSFQLVFLDKVPEYAVFSEMKALAGAMGCSSREESFAHAVLKRVAEKKKECRARHEALLSGLVAFDGSRALAAEELAALNVSEGFLSVLSHGPQGDGRKAVLAALSMKAEHVAMGWERPWAADDELHVQGESSRFSCKKFAEEILKKARARPDGQPLRVLEAAAGKGGKLFGTIAELMNMASQGTALPRLEWLSVDRSENQLGFLKRELEKLSKSSSGVTDFIRVSVELGDWSAPDRRLERSFDLIWLDAPCSAFGTLSKHPEIALTRGMRAEECALGMAAIQRGLIEKSARCLKAGGLFFYSVCTLSAEETVRQAELIAGLLGARERREWALWPGQPPLPSGEGFYIAMQE